MNPNTIKVIEGIEIPRQIANTILAQAGSMVLGSIGCQRPLALNASAEYRGGVRFKVNGPRQYCEVLLDWSDTYTVTHFQLNGNGGERTILSTTSGVFCGQLTDTLWAATQH